MCLVLRGISNLQYAYISYMIVTLYSIACEAVKPGHH